MPLSGHRRAAVYVLLGIVLVRLTRYLQRRNDPLDYLGTAHQPQLSISRFEDLKSYDPLSYQAAVNAIREFSRLYQSSFLADARAMDVLRCMALAKRRMHKELHTLRQWLPNDARMERRVLAAIEELDGRMALAMAEVTERFPETKLAYGAGRVPDVVRAADDIWM